MMFQILRRRNIPEGAQYFTIKINPDPHLPEVRLWGVEKWRALRVKEMEYNGVTILKTRGKTVSGYFYPNQSQSRAQSSKEDTAHAA